MKQSNIAKRWDLLPYQEALRPSRDQNVEFAVIATYSLDLPSLASALLALSRQDDDKASGTPVGLVTAVNRLRGRFRILHQKGRLLRPSRIPRMAPILDQFRYEVSTGSRHSSWHPKAFLIKLKGNNQTQWRFWLGSKNLTSDESWDFGLLLASHPLNKGLHIPGIVEAALEMVRRSELPAVSVNAVRRQLEETTWQIPNGVSIKEVRWLDSSSRSYPEVPSNSSKVYVVSPFLDSKTLKHFASHGGQRLLLSLDCEVSRLATESPESLTAYAGGIHGMAKPTDDIEPNEANSDELDPPDSLHAKLFYIEAAKRRVLWVGSSNATSRGLTGPNIEVVARLELSPELALGMENFIRSQRLLDLQTIPRTEESKSDRLKRELEAFREEFLLKYRLVQQRTAESLEIVISPQLEIPNRLIIRMATLLGDLKTCPNGANSLLFPAVALHELSDLIQVQIELEEETLSWLQTAPLSPPIDETRDDAVIRKNLTLPERFAFLRLILDGVPAGEGRSWDEDAKLHGRSQLYEGLLTPLPTLEQILKADRLQLTAFSKSFRTYFEKQEWTKSEISPKDLQLLSEFESMWATVEAALVTEEKV
jgi:hypothetical protein